MQFVIATNQVSLRHHLSPLCPASMDTRSQVPELQVLTKTQERIVVGINQGDILCSSALLFARQGNACQEN